jgi:hypothetical protein
MISLQTIRRNNLAVNEKQDINVLCLLKIPQVSKRTKVYAVDYTGRNFIRTSNGETIRNSFPSILRSA